MHFQNLCKLDPRGCVLRRQTSKWSPDLMIYNPNPDFGLVLARGLCTVPLGSVSNTVGQVCDPGHSYSFHLHFMDYALASYPWPTGLHLPVWFCLLSTDCLSQWDRKEGGGARGATGVGRRLREPLTTSQKSGDRSCCTLWWGHLGGSWDSSSWGDSGVKQTCAQILPVNVNCMTHG